MKPYTAAFLAVGMSACAIPRAGMQMMGAERLGSGNAEVGLATGVGLSAQANRTTSTQLQLPVVEANARLGLTDFADLNLHLGANGIQPGLKLGMTLGPLEVAAMPTVAFGLFRQEANGQSAFGFNFEGGLRAMASHPIGAFAGVGYALQFASLAVTGSGATSLVAHNFGVNVGWSLKLGPFQVRPELALIFAAANLSSGGVNVPQGVLFTVMPGVTVATGSSK